MTAPVHVTVGDQRPCVLGKIQNRTAISSPACLVEGDFQPRRAGAAGNVVNADGLARSGCGPICAGLSDAVDGFVLDVDEFAGGRIIRLKTEDFAEAILYAGARRGANPIILADHNREVGYRIAIRGSAQIRDGGSGLVVLGDFVAV